MLQHFKNAILYESSFTNNLWGRLMIDMLPCFGIAFGPEITGSQAVKPGEAENGRSPLRILKNCFPQIINETKTISNLAVGERQYRIQKKN